VSKQGDNRCVVNAGVGEVSATVSDVHRITPFRQVLRWGGGGLSKRDGVMSAGLTNAFTTKYGGNSVRVHYITPAVYDIHVTAVYRLTWCHK
jgi:hypothetical protein